MHVCTTELPYTNLPINIPLGEEVKWLLKRGGPILEMMPTMCNGGRRNPNMNFSITDRAVLLSERMACQKCPSTVKLPFQHSRNGSRSLIGNSRRTLMCA